jgi:large repetitive protein
LLNLPSGEYTLTINGTRNVTGAYAFRLLDLAQATVITPGTPVSGTLSPADETNLYQFDANAGEQFFFDAKVVNGTNYNSNWRLLDPNGNVVFQTPFGSAYWWGQRAQDVDTLTLTQSGTYTLMVEGYNGDGGSGSYTFNVQPVINPVPEPLIVGNIINGSIDTTGSQKQYSFNLLADSKFYFDSLTNNYSYNWTLTGPNGKVVSNRYLSNSDRENYQPVLNLQSGDYTREHLKVAKIE